MTENFSSELQWDLHLKGSIRYHKLDIFYSDLMNAFIHREIDYNSVGRLLERLENIKNWKKHRLRYKKHKLLFVEFCHQLMFDHTHEASLEQNLIQLFMLLLETDKFRKRI